MTATTQNSNGMPWSSRRSGPSSRQIRQVANSVEENGRSTWHDSAVSCFSSFVFLTPDTVLNANPVMLTSNAFNDRMDRTWVIQMKCKQM